MWTSGSFGTAYGEIALRSTLISENSADSLYNEEVNTDFSFLISLFISMLLYSLCKLLLISMAIYAA